MPLQVNKHISKAQAALIRKEWLCQLVVVIILIIDSIIDINHHGLSISDTIGLELTFLGYHLLLFFIITYVLIPKLFNAKKYILFFISLLGSIAVFGALEEGVLEKILAPQTKGANDVTWQSIYWFFEEILLPLLVFVSVKFVFDSFTQQQKVVEIEKDRLDNELKLLKSQIQPHILFNSLNSLYHFAISKSDKVPDLILKLSNVLRYVLYEGGGEKVPLSKELNFIRDYVDLQQVQYEGRGKISCVINNGAASEIQKVAPFLLIPFIENSFKHSFGSKEKDVLIQITISISDTQSQSLVHGGIGLSNVKKRLDLLYPDKYTLDISNDREANLYSVQLTLNLT